MSEINLTQEFDASVWVDEWMKAIKNDRSIATSEGTMLCWFANAIMAGYDKARAELAEWREDAERLVGNYGYYDETINGWACNYCGKQNKHEILISHAPDCPITLHRELVEKYGQAVDK